MECQNRLPIPPMWNNLAKKVEKQEARSILALLLTLRKHVKHYFHTGLCSVTNRMELDRLINPYEEHILDAYFHEYYGMGLDGYFWPCGEIKPRMEAIRDSIIREWALGWLPEKIVKTYREHIKLTRNAKL